MVEGQSTWREYDHAAQSLYTGEDGAYRKPGDADSTEYYYDPCLDEPPYVGAYVALYTRAAENSGETPEELAKKAAQERRHEEYKQLAGTMRAMRADFFKRLPNDAGTADKLAGLIQQELARGAYIYNKYKPAGKALTQKLAGIYAHYAQDSADSHYAKMYGEFGYKENASLDRLYAAMEALGYECTDEERAYRDGTHGIYAPQGDGGAN
jgi:hypothetical protein